LPGVVRELIRLRREIASIDPHVVHAHYGTTTALVSVLAGRRPLVITFRGSDLNGTAAVSRLRSTMGVAMSQVAALSATEIICVSERLRHVLWWRRGSVNVIPSGIDANVFRPIPIAEARGALGWAPDHRVVLFNASRKSIGKRLDLAQAAVAEAEKLVPGSRMEVLDGHVDPSRIVTLMNGADCLLMKIDVEGSPNVIKEALACNLPIVSVDVGDVRERVTGVLPGRIVERDPQLLGAAIAEILAKPVRSNGREAIAEITTNRIAERLVEIYRRVSGR
jgi:glycosyltransferase involved in cell wall biosynthesis